MIPEGNPLEPGAFQAAPNVLTTSASITCHVCACETRRGNSQRLAKSSPYAGPSAGAEVALLLTEVARLVPCGAFSDPALESFRVGLSLRGLLEFFGVLLGSKLRSSSESKLLEYFWSSKVGVGPSLRSTSGVLRRRVARQSPETRLTLQASQSFSESLRDFPRHWLYGILSQRNSSEREPRCTQLNLSA